MLFERVALGLPPGDEDRLDAGGHRCVPDCERDPNQTQNIRRQFEESSDADVALLCFTRVESAT